MVFRYMPYTPVIAAVDCWWHDIFIIIFFYADYYYFRRYLPLLRHYHYTPYASIITRVFHWLDADAIFLRHYYYAIIYWYCWCRIMIITPLLMLHYWYCHTLFHAASFSLRHWLFTPPLRHCHYTLFRALFHYYARHCYFHYATLLLRHYRHWCHLRRCRDADIADAFITLILRYAATPLYYFRHIITHYLLLLSPHYAFHITPLSRYYADAYIIAADYATFAAFWLRHSFQFSCHYCFHYYIRFSSLLLPLRRHYAWLLYYYADIAYHWCLRFAYRCWYDIAITHCWYYIYYFRHYITLYAFIDTITTFHYFTLLRLRYAITSHFHYAFITLPLPLLIDIFSLPLRHYYDITPLYWYAAPRRCSRYAAATTFAYAILFICRHITPADINIHCRYLPLIFINTLYYFLIPSHYCRRCFIAASTLYWYAIFLLYLLPCFRHYIVDADAAIFHFFSRYAIADAWLLRRCHMLPLMPLYALDIFACRFHLLLRHYFSHTSLLPLCHWCHAIIFICRFLRLLPFTIRRFIGFLMTRLDISPLRRFLRHDNISMPFSLLPICRRMMLFT